MRYVIREKAGQIIKKKMERVGKLGGHVIFRGDNFFFLFFLIIENFFNYLELSQLLRTSLIIITSLNY